jgi:hypothetical protein
MRNASLKRRTVLAVITLNRSGMDAHTMALDHGDAQNVLLNTDDELLKANVDFV